MIYLQPGAALRSSIDCPAMRIGAAVLHYRAWPQVRVTLDALLSQTREVDEVILLDNGSDDGSGDRVREAYPALDVHGLTRNVGPIAGWNHAVQAILGRAVDAVLLVPHDCRLAPNAVEVMASRLEKAEDLAAVGPLLGYLSDPDEVWSAGGDIHPRSWDTNHLRVPASISEWKGRAPYEVEWLDGSGLMLRADAIRAAGALHEEFFYFFEEVDYLLRLRSLGWRVECVPRAVAWQDPGGLSPYVFVRNRLGFLARNAPRRFLFRELARVAYYLGRDTVSPRYEAARRDVWPRFRGVVDFLRGRWGPPPASLTAPKTR
jgi:GT2 family glycosyltransferase